MNRVVAVGSLSAPPKTFQSQNGKSFTVCTLLDKRTWRDADGFEQSAKAYWRIAAYGPVGTALSEYGEGDTVAVTGTLSSFKKTRKDGTEGYETQIKLDSIETIAKADVVSEDDIPF